MTLSPKATLILAFLANFALGAYNLGKGGAFSVFLGIVNWSAALVVYFVLTKKEKKHDEPN